MRQNTKGIVLHYTKYSETSLIVKIITKDTGLRSFIVKGIRKKKAKLNTNLLRPLSLLDMEVYTKGDSGDQLGQLINFSSCNVDSKEDFAKNAVVLFIAELLYKTIDEGDANVDCFNYLWRSTIELQKSNDYLNFHIVFMVNLTKYLGFFPNNENAIIGGRFNIVEGIFVLDEEPTDYCMSLADSISLASLIPIAVENHQDVKLSHEKRNSLLDQLLLFYCAQLPNMKKINSHLVLREVMS